LAAVVLVLEQIVAAPRERVWEWFQRPARLALLHGANGSLRLLRHHERVELGGETWIELRLAPLVPVVLGFREHLVEPPERFGETLIHGPFRHFVHVHEFEPADGGTLVRDRLAFSLPILFGGSWAARSVASRVVRAAFAERHRALAAICARGEL
jgi:ligand-binding SRPBCC domain-containing protein